MVVFSFLTKWNIFNWVVCLYYTTIIFGDNYILHICLNYSYFVTNKSLIYLTTGSRPGHRRLHHHVRARTSGRLHHALHEPRHQHPVPASGPPHPEALLVPAAAQPRSVAVHGRGVHGGQPPAVRRVAVLAVRVARAVLPVRGGDGARVPEVLLRAEQSVVHGGISHEAELGAVS